jgi:hypothetical protein
MFDQFDTVAGSNLGAFLHLESPATGSPAYVTGDDGEPDETRPIGVNLYGPDAKAYRALTRLRASQLIKQRAGKMDLKKMSVEQIQAFVLDGEKSNLMDAVDATFGWSNITIDGKYVDYSSENAVLLYKRYPEILRQVSVFQGEAGNFLQTA